MLPKHKRGFPAAAADALGPLRQAAAAPPAQLLSRGYAHSVHHFVEGVHFDGLSLSASALGRRIVSTCLFRVAAQGLRPESVQISTGVHSGVSQTYLHEVFRGMEAVALEHKVALQPGNTLVSPTALFFSLLIGARPLRALPKAKAGDTLAVTGFLGTAMAGLQCQKRLGTSAMRDYPELVAAHNCPAPPLKACLLLSRQAVSGTVALVDGLSGELHWACRQWKLGAHIQQKAIPVHPKTPEAARQIGVAPEHWALFGADDFALLLAIPPGKVALVKRHFAKHQVPLTEIGNLAPQKAGIRITNLEGENSDLAERIWNPVVRTRP